MKKLFFTIVLVIITFISYAQENTTFLMTSQKNEVCKRTTSKWITTNRTYDNIEIEYRDGIVYFDNNSDSKFTPIGKGTIKKMDGFERFTVLCYDKNEVRCEFAIYRYSADDEIFMCTIEYSDYKYFYYKYK